MGQVDPRIYSLLNLSYKITLEFLTRTRNCRQHLFHQSHFLLSNSRQHNTKLSCQQLLFCQSAYCGLQRKWKILHDAFLGRQFKRQDGRKLVGQQMKCQYKMNIVIWKPLRNWGATQTKATRLNNQDRRTSLKQREIRRRETYKIKTIFQTKFSQMYVIYLLFTNK